MILEIRFCQIWQDINSGGYKSNCGAWLTEPDENKTWTPSHFGYHDQNKIKVLECYNRAKRRADLSDGIDGGKFKISVYKSAKDLAGDIQGYSASIEWRLRDPLSDEKDQQQE